jgi:flagellar hook-basal body complex protein FliE
MNISNINNISSSVLKNIENLKNPDFSGDSLSAAGVKDESFLDTIKDSLDSVIKAQEESDNKINQFISGENMDIAGTMIASQKAELGMQLTLQIRNKLVEAYQEIMRTQV